MKYSFISVGLWWMICSQYTFYYLPNLTEKRKPSAPKQKAINKRDKLLSPTQSKYKFHGLMFPRNDILNHPAGNTLMGYAVNGCPVDCGADWPQTFFAARHKLMRRI